MRNILIAVALFFGVSTVAIAAFPSVITLLGNAKSVGATKAVQFDAGKTNTRLIQAVLTGASAVSATAAVEGSIDGSNWTSIATLQVASSPAASQVANTTVSAPWPAIRTSISAISSVAGASAPLTATVNVYMAE